MSLNKDKTTFIIVLTSPQKLQQRSPVLTGLKTSSCLQKRYLTLVYKFSSDRCAEVAGRFFSARLQRLFKDDDNVYRLIQN